MAYPPRLVPVGVPSHVRIRAVARELLFIDDADYEAMAWRLGRETQRHRWQCLAYCLMPNHVHLVLRPLEDNVPAGMRNLSSSYARRFNERWGRRGHLVERRYWATAAGDDAHLYRMLRYVALNPVAAGLVENPALWPHSSYAASIGLADAPPWLEARALLDLFDRNGSRARRLFRDYVEQQPR